MTIATATEKKTRRKHKHDAPPPTNVGRYTKSTDIADVSITVLERSRRLVAAGKCGTIDRLGNICDDIGFPCPKHPRSQVDELIVREPSGPPIDGENSLEDAQSMTEERVTPMTFGAEIRIPLDEIYFGGNPRLDQEADSGKMESMRTFAARAMEGAPGSVMRWGNPIWVVRRLHTEAAEEDDKHYEWNCIDGMGRCLASKRAGWVEINATEVEGSEEDIELTRMLANEWPRRLTPYEVARFFTKAKERLRATSAEDLIERLRDQGIVSMPSASHYMKLARIWTGLTPAMTEDWGSNWGDSKFMTNKLTLDELDELAGIEDKADQLYAYDQWIKTGKLVVVRKTKGNKRGRPSFMFLDSPTIARRPKELVNRVSEIHTLLTDAKAPPVIMQTLGAVSKALITDIPLDEGEFKKWISSLEKHAKVDAKPIRTPAKTPKPKATKKSAKTKPKAKAPTKKPAKTRR